MDSSDIDTILVFPSNVDGTYNKGVTHVAVQKYGYIIERGNANTICGRAWAIPTRDASNKPLDLRELKRYIDRLLMVASNKHVRNNTIFKVTSFPSHKTEDVAPMFALATENVILPIKYKPYVMEPKGRQWWTA